MAEIKRERIFIEYNRDVVDPVVSATFATPHRIIIGRGGDSLFEELPDGVDGMGIDRTLVRAFTS